MPWDNMKICKKGLASCYKVMSTPRRCFTVGSTIIKRRQRCPGVMEYKVVSTVSVHRFITWKQNMPTRLIYEILINYPEDERRGCDLYSSYRLSVSLSLSLLFVRHFLERREKVMMQERYRWYVLFLKQVL